MIFNDHLSHTTRSFHYESYYQNFIDGFRHSNILRRTQEAANCTFNKIRDFFYNAKEPQAQINLKTISIISCLCLVTLIVVSIFWLKDKAPKQETAPSQQKLESKIA